MNDNLNKLVTTDIRMLSTFLMLLMAWLCGMNSGQSMPVTVEILNEWTGRLHATLVVTATEDINGWEIILQSTGTLQKLDIPKGDEAGRSDDNMQVILVNKPEYSIVKQGDTLELEVYVNYDGSQPTLSGELINLGSDNYVPPDVPVEHDGAKYNYNLVLEESILFYEAQRSGKLPADNRIAWRGDSALDDQGDAGEDLSGGWYDAGDHVKFNFPMAYTVTTLTWGLLEFQDAYEDAGQLEYMYDCIKWPLDYLVKCHVSPDVYYAQVGSGEMDHNYWGRPEAMTMARPAYKVDAANPGSDVAAETAAAMAAGYMAFKNSDPDYAASLLQHAEELFAFAEAYPGKYSDSIPEANSYYSSYDELDEMCWGGAWLYLATADEHYLDVAEANYFPDGPAWGQSWDEKISGCMVLLYKITQKQIYLDDIELTFEDWMPGGSIPYTPGGLAWRSQWGSNRYAANMALIAIMASVQGINAPEYQTWAESQINFMLGDGGRSYVVGFGENPPQQPHHRSSSCPNAPAPCGSQQMTLDEPNVHTLYGALVGGPGENGDYNDRRNDYTHNEVAVDYNSGFQSAVAGLKALYMRGEMP